MARIAGVDLPREKKVEIGLTYIFGIGRKTAREILSKTGVDAALRVKDLVEADVNKLRQIIERDYRVEGVASPKLLPAFNTMSVPLILFGSKCPPSLNLPLNVSNLSFNLYPPSSALTLAFVELAEEPKVGFWLIC